MFNNDIYQHKIDVKHGNKAFINTTFHVTLLLSFCPYTFPSFHAHDIPARIEKYICVNFMLNVHMYT